MATHNPASVADARLSVEELQLHKRELMAEREELSSQINQVRAQHRSITAHNAAPVQLPGMFGTVLRGIEKAAGVMAQTQLDLVIQPLENEKLRLDAALAEIDSVLSQLERYIQENS